MSLIIELEKEKARLENQISVLQVRLDMVNGLLDDTVAEEDIGAFDSWYVPSQSDSSIGYVVARHQDGHFSCDCPDFIYRGKSEDYYKCKHICKVLEEIRPRRNRFD